MFKWFHESLSHPGSWKLINTLKELVFWENMIGDIKSWTNKCTICQKSKQSKIFGQAFHHNKSLKPFENIGVDTVGPLEKYIDEDGIEYKYILTIIDHFTKIVELIPLKSLNSGYISKVFDKEWLRRYPRPNSITADNAFKNREFTELANSYGIELNISTPHNPQSNGVVERMHFYLNNCITCLGKENWVEHLPAISWGIKSSYHSSINTTPSHLVYGVNMFSNQRNDINKEIEKAADAINNQRLRDENKQNKTRVKWNYKENDMVYLKNINISKHERKYEGPYRIMKVNDNCTLKLDIDGKNETINIRRVKPVRDENNLKGGKDVLDIVLNYETITNPIRSGLN